MPNTKAYAIQSPRDKLAPFSFDRREPGAKDVQVEILYCGVCHSDIHQARDEWGGSLYPMVPGHEIIGRVTKAGNAVTKFKKGDLAQAFVGPKSRIVLGVSKEYSKRPFG